MMEISGHKNIIDLNIKIYDESMLKIENYSKLLRKEVGRWRIGKVEAISSAYLIRLWMQDGTKMQVNLERTPIGKQKEYELWCWNDRPSKVTGLIAQTATPIRIMLQKHNIKDMDKLLGSIEYLIRNL